MPRTKASPTPGRIKASEGAPSPGWIHVAGGTGPAPPGGKRSATERLRPGNYIAYDAPFQNEGQGLKFGLASFKVEGKADALAVAGVTGLTVTIPPGQRVRPLPDGDRYLGFVFAEADTPADVEHALTAAVARLRVVVQ